MDRASLSRLLDSYRESLEENGMGPDPEFYEMARGVSPYARGPYTQEQEMAQRIKTPTVTKADVLKRLKWPPKLETWAANKATIKTHATCAGCGCYYCNQGLDFGTTTPTQGACNDYVSNVRTLAIREADIDKLKAEMPAQRTVTLAPSKLPVVDGKPNATQKAGFYKDKLAGYWILEGQEWRRVSRVALPDTYTEGPTPEQTAKLSEIEKEVVALRHKIVAFEKKLK